MKKTKKLLLSLILLSALILACLYLHRPSDRRLPDRYGGNIEAFVSETDKDNDGVEDQTDIINSAWEYLAARPQYKSRYYAGGYPDDTYGVCTDVIAFALKGAGYDLSALVDEDIRNHPENYNVEIPDANIDFRRVRNLLVYFENNALSLSCDVQDIEEWQGGDIVIFHEHIGIVSGQRNKDGIPYLIHHYGPFQLFYEEDVLHKRNDIKGHYRFPGV